MRISRPVPERYRDYFVEVCIDGQVTIQTSAGTRGTITYRWKCNSCGKCIKENSAGAQSHVAMHVRQTESKRII